MKASGKKMYTNMYGVLDPKDLNRLCYWKQKGEELGSKWGGL